MENVASTPNNFTALPAGSCCQLCLTEPVTVREQVLAAAALYPVLLQTATRPIPWLTEGTSAWALVWLCASLMPQANCKGGENSGCLFFIFGWLMASLTWMPWKCTWLSKLPWNSSWPFWNVNVRRNFRHPAWLPILQQEGGKRNFWPFETGMGRITNIHIYIHTYIYVCIYVHMYSLNYSIYHLHISTTCTYLLCIHIYIYDLQYQSWFCWTKSSWNQQAAPFLQRQFRQYRFSAERFRAIKNLCATFLISLGPCTQADWVFSITLQLERKSVSALEKRSFQSGLWSVASQTYCDDSTRC